jgi:hypothetical protein
MNQESAPAGTAICNVYSTCVGEVAENARRTDASAQSNPPAERRLNEIQMFQHQKPLTGFWLNLLLMQSAQNAAYSESEQLDHTELKTTLHSMGQSFFIIW